MVLVASDVEYSEVITGEALASLHEQLTGTIILPGDAEYDSARLVWNGGAERHPALIVRVASKEDVQAAVRWARSHNMPLSIRGGGHNYAGTAMVNAGLALDMRLFNSVTVDPVAQRARVGAGVLWRDFDAATAAHGLAGVGGQISSVGVSGFTLGGGIGWLSRKHGLAADNLISAEVVLADGSIVRASEEENADLLWALRGAGANFGVVTEFEFALHPLNMIVGGMVAYKRDDGAKVLSFVRDYAKTAPDELSMIVLMSAGPNIGPATMLAFCYAGDVAAGQEAVQPLREIAVPLADMVALMPYAALQATNDQVGHPGVRHYDRSGYTSELTDEAIEAIIAAANSATSPMSQIQVRQLGGALNRIAPDATAYPHRDVPFMVNFIAGWIAPDSSADALHHTWTDAGYAAVQSIMTSAVYVNFLNESGAASIEIVKSAYGANYARLAELKAKYDPDNFFSVNQNILPAGK